MTLRDTDSPPERGTMSFGPGGTVEKGLTRRAIAGMFWTLSGTGLQGLVQLLVLMVLGRLLTPAEFGIMGAATVVIALSQIVSQIGVGPAIIQRRELDPLHIRVAATLSFMLGLVLGALVFFGAPVIARFYRIPEVEPVLRLVAFMFPLDGLNTVSKALLTRKLQFRLYVALDVGSYIVGYALVGVALAWHGAGVWSLATANLCQVALRMLAMYTAARHSLRPSFNLAASRDLLTFGLGHSLGQIGAVISQQGDNFFVGRYLGPAALGLYGRAYSLMVMPATAFGRIVMRVLFPLLSQLQDERERLGNAYERGLALVALVSLPVSTFLWVLAPEFIGVVLGPRWSGVLMPFRLFSISLLFRMSSRISDECSKAAGRVYVRAVLIWSYGGLVVLGAIVGQRWGIGGVAVGVSFAMAFNWVSMAWLTRVVTGVTWVRFLRAHMPAALLATLVALTAAAAAQVARGAHLKSVFVLPISALAAAATVYLAARTRPQVWLGPHGTWALRRIEDLLRRRSARLTLAAERARAE
ncbi:MAG: lipopolysaccharide biosynthesis protein [Gemmatimonadales bacterium]